MFIQIDEKAMLSITIPNAHVMIDYHIVNRAEPIVTRAPSTFEDVPVLENGAPKIDENGDQVIDHIETLGPVISSTPAFNVSLFLMYMNEAMEAVYARKNIAIDGLTEEELNFPTFYEKLLAMPEFENGKIIK